MSSLFQFSSTISTLDIRKIDDYDISFLQMELKDFNSLSKITNYHKKRQQEFLLGRFSAKMNFKKNYQYDLADLDFGIDRNPIWPNNFVGSISHSKSYAISAIGLKKELNYLGIDVESISRVNDSIAQKILIDRDIKQIDGFDLDELYTLIFSAKESFYKALFPKYGKYFGFENAFVNNISIENSTFEISLANDLNDHFTMAKFKSIPGKYYIFENHIISLIEISSLNELRG
jgi:4'-phosphopantetheinyl transferase EntD